MHIDLAKSLGLNAFRMGIEWARIQPTYVERPTAPPAWDMAAVDRYAEIISMVIEAGMEPIVTLFHFMLPAWCGEYFWLSQGMACCYVDWAARAVEEVNRRVVDRSGRPVTFWITMNEPNIYALIGLTPLGHPKGFNALASAHVWRDNLMLAHTLLYDRIYDIHEANGWEKPTVTFNTACNAFYEIDRALYDLMRARSLGVPREGLREYFAERKRKWDSDFEAIAAWRWEGKTAQMAMFKAMRALVGRVFDPLRMTAALDAIYASKRTGKLDCLGLDIYDPFIGVPELKVPDMRMVKLRRVALMPEWWEYTIEPEQFRGVLEAHAALNPDGLPIYIIETGIGHYQEKHGQAEPRPDGQGRIDFLRYSIGETMRAIALGLPVKGYLYWTLVDNYEWGSFKIRLGLYDFDHSTGTIKELSGLGEPAGETYKEIVAALRGRDPARIRAALGLEN